jgi:putative transposase
MVPETEDGLRATLGEAHRRYTTMVNERHGWRGHLWQERFHSFPMDEFHLLATARYVEMNPVAANLCYLPEDWKWSSAIAHLTGTDDGLVRVQPMLDRVDDWKSFLSSYIETEPVNMIRKHSRTGRPLGNNSFVNHLEELTGRKLRPRTRGPGQKMLD